MSSTSQKTTQQRFSFKPLVTYHLCLFPKPRAYSLLFNMCHQRCVVSNDATKYPVINSLHSFKGLVVPTLLNDLKVVSFSTMAGSHQVGISDSSKAVALAGHNGMVVL